MARRLRHPRQANQGTPCRLAHAHQQKTRDTKCKRARTYLWGYQAFRKVTLDLSKVCPFLNGKLNQDSNQWWNFLVRCFFNKKKNVTNICFDILNAHSQLSQTVVHSKGGFKSEDTWECLLLQNKHSKSLSWGKKLNKLNKWFGDVKMLQSLLT